MRTRAVQQLAKDGVKGILTARIPDRYSSVFSLQLSHFLHGLSVSARLLPTV
jgi:hypothetical protein